MKNFFVAAMTALCVLVAASAFAQEAPTPATKSAEAFESVTLKIDWPIIVQVHAAEDPFLAAERSTPVQLTSPAELLTLQKTYGGILIASTGSLCAATDDTNVASYVVSYGLIGANVGTAIMHFSADVDFAELIKPVAKQKWDESKKWLAKCTLVDDKKIVIEFGASN